MTDALCLGVELPAFAARGEEGPGGPSGRPDQGILERLSADARTLEDAGFGALWLQAGPPGARGADPFALAGALAARTSSLGLGMLDRLEGRQPAVLGREASTVGVLSSGRAAILLEAGGPRSRRDRLGALAEAVWICRSVVTGELPAFKGRHFALGGSAERPTTPESARALVVAGMPPDADLGAPEAAPALERLAAVVDAVVVEGDADRVRTVSDALAGLEAGRGGQPGRPGGGPAGSRVPGVLWRGELAPGAEGDADEAIDAGARGLLLRWSGVEALDAWVARVARHVRQGLLRSGAPAVEAQVSDD